jgi:hypothetical protein
MPLLAFGELAHQFLKERDERWGEWTAQFILSQQTIQGYVLLIRSAILDAQEHLPGMTGLSLRTKLHHGDNGASVEIVGIFRLRRSWGWRGNGNRR